MKQILTTLSLFFSLHLFAQQSFEGTIIYTLKMAKEKDTMQLNIDFSSHAIKVRPVEPKKHYDEDNYFLINLDSGKCYSVDVRRKSYTASRLSEKRAATEVPPVKTIAGYNAIGELYNEAGVNGIFGSLLSNKTIFYSAEKLFYYVPEKYAGNYELMMVQKDRIILGAEISFAPRLGFFGGRGEANDSIDAPVITIEATEILPKKFDASEFTIPSDYVKNRPYSYLPDVAMDSIRMVDSAVVAPEAYYADTAIVMPPKIITKKKPSPSPKKKSSSKTNAIHRKDD